MNNSIKRARNGYVLQNNSGQLTKYPTYEKAMFKLFINACMNVRNAPYSEVNF